MTLYPEKGGFDGGVNRDGTGAEITVAAYSETVPNLREEYNKYGVVQIMPLTAYQRISNSIPLKEKTMYINIQTDSDAGIGEIEKKAVSMLGSNYDYMVENRPDAEKRNIEIYDYYRKIIGAVCVLLACIGIANVFANTLGFVFQRKREFARYQSIGLTPNGIMKMFGVEMLIIGVKPILLSIPFNAVFILFAVNRSGVEISEFMERLPVFSTVAFTCFVLLAIGISYFIGSKQIKQTNITDALKNDALF